MKTYVIYCIVAAVVAWIFSFAVTPMVRIFAYRIGAIDVPKDGRRMHKTPTPLLGGLAIWFGFTLTSVLFWRPFGRIGHHVGGGNADCADRYHRRPVWHQSDA